MAKRLRILVVDDSWTAREVIHQLLESDPDLEVVDTAENGQEAVDKVRNLKPDLVTMDIHMPVMNGMEAIEEIMAYHPTPILVVTGDADVKLAFDCLTAGALEVVRKPELEGEREGAAARFVSQVKLLAGVPVVSHIKGRRRGRPTLPALPESNLVVGVVSSTGGPHVLATILRDLPANLPAPVCIVQHLSDGFTEGLVQWLDDVSPLTVKTAEAGERLEPGTVFIAPTDYHMEVTPSHRISLHQEPPEVNQRPAGNVLLRSIARIYGGRAVGVVLTGMGEDGARGLERLARVGARTIAQDEETSIVFGMPKVAIERGAAQEVLPSSVIAEAITRLVVELQKQSPGDAGS